MWRIKCLIGPKQGGIIHLTVISEWGGVRWCVSRRQSRLDQDARGVEGDEYAEGVASRERGMGRVFPSPADRGSGGAS